MTECDMVELIVKQAINEVANIDKELFFRKHKLSDAVGTLHIQMFLALEEFRKKKDGGKTLD